MSLDTDLQTKLATLAGSAPVQQNYASIDKVEPRVWYQRTSGNIDLLLNGVGVSENETVYAIEVAGLDPDVTAGIAANLATAMNGFRGVMGLSVILGCFVEDAADDYQPRGLNIDDGYHVFAFSLRVLQ